MSYKSGFFNAVKSGDTYDRLYNAEDMSNYFEGLVTDGVYANVGNSLAVTASGLGVKVDTGRAILDCHWIKNSSILNLSLASADSLSSRKDLVVIKLDKTVEVRDMTVEILKNKSTPPADTDEVKYLVLARITVKAGATSISQSDIEDMRGTKYCLYVTGLIEQIDTSTLFSQFKAAFEDFFETLQSDLRVDTYIANYQATGSLKILIDGDDSSSYVNFELNDFDSAIDVLIVFKNGLFCAKGIDYEITEVTSTLVTIKSLDGQKYTSNDEIYCIMLKSRVGSSTEGINVDA